MHKNRCPVFAQYQVRLTRKLFVVKAKTEAESMQVLTNRQFRCGVFRPYSSHHPAARRGVYYVSHLRKQWCLRYARTFLLGECQYMWAHDARHFANHRHRNRVAELPIGLCVRNRDLKIIREAH